MNKIEEEESFHLEAEKYKKEGNTEFTKRNYEKAISSYTKAINLQEKAPYFSNRAFCYMKTNRLEDGLNDALYAIKIDPTFFRSYSRASQIYLMKGEIDVAEQILSKGIAFVTDGEKLRNEMNNLKVIRLHSTKMKDLYAQKRYKEALSPLEQIMEKCPEDDNLVLQKIDLLCLGNSLEDAIKFTEENEKKLNKMYPPQFYTQISKVHRYNNDLVKAKSYAQMGLKNDPDSAQLKKDFKFVKLLENEKTIATNLFKSGKYEEASDKYLELTKLDPENGKFNAVLTANRATCFKKLGKKAEALASLKEAVQFDDKYGKAFLKRADIEEEDGEYEAARDSIVTAKELDPSLDIDGRLQRVTKKLNSQEKKDYYKVLGIQKNATEKDIKKAYRKLAMKWHPDKHSQDEDSKKKANKMFREINEANDVLSNPEKRRRYDMGGFDMANGMGGSGFGGGGTRFHSFSGGEDIFKMFFGGGGHGMRMNFGGSTRGRRTGTGQRNTSDFFSNSTSHGGFQGFF